MGEYAGTVRLINADGATVATFPANFQSQRLDVPEELPFPRTTVSPSFAKSRGFIEWVWVWFQWPNDTNGFFHIPRMITDW